MDQAAHNKIVSFIWGIAEAMRRRGKVQLIDASQWFKPLRKNLGKKNCELSEDDIQRVMAAYDAFVESEQSKVFANEAFGYWKVTVERPLRLHSQLKRGAIETLRFASGDQEIRMRLYDELGVALFDNFDSVEHALEKRLAEWGNTDADGEDEGDDDAPKKGLPEKKKKNCWMQRPGNVTRDWSKQPPGCEPSSGMGCSRITTSSGTRSMTCSRSCLVSSAPRIESCCSDLSVGAWRLRHL